MTSTTTDILGTYARLAGPFGAVVNRLDDVDWARPSPCESWSARDVLDHVVTTQREFLASHGVGATTSPAVATDPAAAWRAHDEWMRELLADPDVAGVTYDGVFGTTSVGESIVTFYGFDLVVHRWDIAAAAGLDERFGDDELDLIETSAEGFGEHLYDEGVCGPALVPREGADRQERILARLGRAVPS